MLETYWGSLHFGGSGREAADWALVGAAFAASATPMDTVDMVMPTKSTATAVASFHRFIVAPKKIEVCVGLGKIYTKITHFTSISVGWCKDQFGLSWQVVPKEMATLMQRPQAFEHLMSMKKLVIADF